MRDFEYSPESATVTGLTYLYYSTVVEKGQYARDIRKTTGNLWSCLILRRDFADAKSATQLHQLGHQLLRVA